MIPGSILMMTVPPGWPARVFVWAQALRLASRAWIGFGIAVDAEENPW